MTLIEELERLRDEATPGPWEAHQGIDDAAPSVWDITSRHNHTDYGETPKGWFLATVHEVVSEESARNDAALIVALRNNLDTIIAALKAAEWRPISEAKRDTLYQLFEPHDWGGFQFVGCMNTDGAWINNLDFCIQHPTHFKPLGPRPEGEG